MQNKLKKCCTALFISAAIAFCVPAVAYNAAANDEESPVPAIVISDTDITNGTQSTGGTAEFSATTPPCAPSAQPSTESVINDTTDNFDNYIYGDANGDGLV